MKQTENKCRWRDDYYERMFWIMKIAQILC